MSEMVFILLCALLAAGVICRPDRFLFRYLHRRDDWMPEPYLGEFIPAESEADRSERERLTQFHHRVRKAS